jgi:hypothetical protein
MENRIGSYLDIIIEVEDAPLSEQELKDFLTTKVLNMHLGTVDENGHAIIRPVGYYYGHSMF